MKLLGKFLLISTLLYPLNGDVYASLYRITFNYGPDDDGETGILTGFMDLDLSQGSGSTQIQQDLGIIDIPSWITNISLTFDPDNGGATRTTTTFASVNWDLKTTSIGSFDVTSDFVNQMDGFGFFSSPGGDYFIANSGFVQQEIPSNTEFPMETTTTTPGGLPFLGLGVLALYYTKLKSKDNYKL